MCHHNTLFSQTLQFIHRHVFQKLERRHKTGRFSRKFRFKGQYTAMAFIQLDARRSRRDGLRWLDAVGFRLYRCGLKTVARSTFSDANNPRPVGFFRYMFAEMYALCAAKAPKHKFRFQSNIQSGLHHHQALPLSISLGLISPGQRWYQNAHHTLLDHDGHIPAFTTVTDARTHENRILRSLEFPKDSIVVFDKGFLSYPWFRSLGKEAYFL